MTGTPLPAPPSPEPDDAEPEPARPAGTAVVVGGGIGGLAAALALRRIGWSATVLERAPAFGEVGAGMSQSPNALRALDALGVGERARSVGVPFHGPFDLRTPTGRHLVKAPPDSGTPLLGFHRSDLHRVLLEALPPAWLRTGAEVTGVRQVAGGAVVESAVGDLRAEVVIGADGAHSIVRRTLWPEAGPPRFTGGTVWRGIAPTRLERGFMVMGRGAYALAMPVAGDRVYWALAWRADGPGRRYDDEHAEVARRVADWPDDLRALVAATPAEAVLHHDVFDLAPLPDHARGTVALLGDAAHLMCPDLAQGAGQALEDAVVLAAALATESGTRAALARYDAERRPRSQWVARSARDNARQNLAAGRVAHAALVVSMSLVPSSRWARWAERGLAKLWGWRPPALPEPRP
ncbi:FAD-dependent monooxygenase [Streptomonospora sp. S1-112]|uniref:FAD-dependent monooxygenase n=1 Tax=Streptomonospora mangrovi TaxID=2883123 RepID=A0A9X3NYN6_9ACTN|nr:FAD-dependent monooxygenase [Streptomonospora mangrovi]MDA0566841.1 FAD-dependent monooxygenase [Streptomonospora mangrovi]